MRRSVLALACVLALSACGSEATDGDAGSGPEPSGARIVLQVDVTADEGAQPSSYVLECDPTGGDHPQPEQACDVLAREGAAAFDPVPADRMCTEIYGGPQTAVVRGVWDGEKVEATFSRTDGCEIDRWDRLGTTFFAVPLQ